MSLVGISKYFVGFIMAIAIIVGIGAGLVRYALGYMAASPPRPSFPNDTPAAKNTAGSNPTANVAIGAASPAAAASPDLPPGAYQARVVQPVGLIVRDQPSADGVQLDGIEFEQTLTVLENSADGAWQRVRLANGSEGWVKGGNTEQIN